MRSHRTIFLAWLLLWPLASSAQQNQCRTSPAGTVSSYCASEAFVTDSANGPMAPVIFTEAGDCISALTGTRVVISDSTTNTLGAVISGGGSDQVLAWCNGTNWTVVGK